MVLGGGDIGGYVDLGLPSGLLWCVHNVGGTNQEDYGYYFSWGNVDGHIKDSGYKFNSTDYNNTPGKSLTGNIPVDETYDIARKEMGSPWRLPTRLDFKELYNRTDSEWVADYNGTGVAGRKFMKKSDHSVFIFLPACGYYNSTTLNNEGTYGRYWSSGYNNSTAAYGMDFRNNTVSFEQYLSRYQGLSGRAVQKPTYSITITLIGDLVEGITVTLTDSDDVSHSGTTDANGVVQLSGVVSGSAKVSASGYQLTNSSITVNASSRSFTCGFAPLGVWAYYADGTFKSEAEADTDAIGVAVVTANCGFVIDKLATNNNRTIGYGGYNKNLSDIGVVITSDANTANLDFAGESNTTKIINALYGINDGNATGAAAAEACRAAFNGNGYMGSLGEWSEAYTNKSAVDSIMTKIGGTAIGTYSFWCSTLGDNNQKAWVKAWNNGNQSSTNRSNTSRVRAFKAL